MADWRQVDGNNVLVGTIRTAMKGRQFGEEVSVDLTNDERERVMAVLRE